MRQENRGGLLAKYGLISALLVVTAGTASAQVIRLHDATDYQGANTDIISEVSDLATVDFSNKAKSVTVLGGAWLACRGTYLSGPCVVIREPAANLGMFGMSTAIQSVRPLPDTVTYEHGTVFSRDSVGGVIFYRPTGETSVTPIGPGSAAPPVATPSQSDGYSGSSESYAEYSMTKPESGPGADNYKGPRYPSVILYRQRDYQGPSLGTERDLRTLWPDDFDNATSSIEILNGEWEVCEDDNFEGKCVVIDADQDRLWELQMDNRISSIRQVPEGTRWREAREAREREQREDVERAEGIRKDDLVLFEHGNFGGRGFPTNGSAINLGDMNDKASSIRVRKGRWEVCEHGGFTGKCVEVSSDVRDLNSLGMNDKLSSVRRLD